MFLLKQIKIVFQDRNSDPERSIFGAYYDEGRMARNTGTDWVWAELGRRSILNYNNVEQESGSIYQYRIIVHEISILRLQYI